MNYITVSETVDEKSNKVKKSDKLHINRTIEISPDHPLAIAAEKAKKDYEEGKLLSISDAIQQLIDEEN